MIGHKAQTVVAQAAAGVDNSLALVVIKVTQQVIT